jgi:hypothetical protein
MILIQRWTIWLPALATAGIIAVVLSSCGGGGDAPVGRPGASLTQAQLPSIPKGYDFVTKRFGLTRVKEGDFQSPDMQAIPWTGYWFPKQQKEMFAADPDTGELSPLQRYDQWVKKVKGVESHAADIEAGSYDPQSDSWEGLCNAWAAASIKEPGPTQDTVVDGVKFRAIDLRALLIKTHDGKPEGYTQYGERNEGTGQDFQDIYPDQFHRFLQVQLFDNGQPFIMDKDPGPEVWNVPVFAAESQLMRDPADSHVMHVRTWITYANFSHDFLYNGSTEQVVKEYTYDLYGIQLPDGSFEVHSGFWTMVGDIDSTLDHPDFVTLLPDDDSSRASFNQGLNSQWVDEIVAAAMADRSSTANP